MEDDDLGSDTSLPVGITIVDAPGGGGFAQGECGQTITEDVTLTDDIGPCAGDGIIIGLGGGAPITLYGDGFKIFGTGAGSGIRVEAGVEAFLDSIFVRDFAVGVELEPGVGPTDILTLDIRDTTAGVMGDGSGTITLHATTLAANGTGLDLTPSFGPTAEVYHNLFLTNTLNVSAGTPAGVASWTHPFTGLPEGNYWDTYWGDDTDADGIGDTDIPTPEGDPAPIVDPSLPQAFAPQICGDLVPWLSWIVFRGHLPDPPSLLTPDGRTLSDATNDLGDDGFYITAPSTFDPILTAVQVLHATCEPNGVVDGTWTFDIPATQDADYVVQWWASGIGARHFDTTGDAGETIANGETDRITIVLTQIIDPGGFLISASGSTTGPTTLP